MSVVITTATGLMMVVASTISMMVMTAVAAAAYRYDDDDDSRRCKLRLEVKRTSPHTTGKSRRVDVTKGTLDEKRKEAADTPIT